MLVLRTKTKTCHDKPASIGDIAAAPRKSPRHALRSGSLPDVEVLKQDSERLMRKLAQKDIEMRTVEEEQLLLAAAFYGAANAVLITDHVGRITWVNAAFTMLTGYSSEEAIGKTPRILKSGQHDAAFYCDFWQTISSGQTWRGEFVNRRKDGSLYYDEHTVTPVRDLEGKITHYVAFQHDVTTRKRTEAALSKSEQKYRRLFETSRDALTTVFPPDWRFVTANAAAVELFGAKDEKEFTSHGPWEVSPERQPDGELSVVKSQRMIATAVEKGSHFFDWTHQKIGGAAFPATVLLTRVELDGQVGLQATIRDITAQKRAEAALRESEGRFRQLANSLPQLVWTCQPDGTCDFLSEQWLAYTGLPAAPQLGSGWLEQLHPDDRAPTMAAWQEIASDQDFHVEFRIRRHDGEYRWFDTQAARLRDVEGRTVKWFGSNTDITERKQAAAELEQTNHQLQQTLGKLQAAHEEILELNRRLEQRVLERTKELDTERRHRALLLNSAGDGLYGLDLEGRISFINPAGARIVGYTIEELLGQSMHLKCHHTYPDGRPFPREECPIYSAFRDGQVHHHDDDVMWRQDGSMVPIEYTSTPIRDDVGRLAGATVVFRDITERKRHEAELAAAKAAAENANRAKSDFLASMSHELRTPLNGILGMNELLLNTELTERQRQFVDASSTSGKALLQQVNDILDLSKIEAGKLELDLHECNLESLLYDVVDMFSYGAQKNGYPLHCHLDPAASVTAVCDSNRVRQILVNLIGNAKKFTTSGSVTVRAKRVQQLDRQLTLRFSVTDTGMGIPEDRRDRLFAPFSQVDQTTSRKFGGTGLGLSICKQLVELMGGQIGVESQVGVGSTFWFEVPVQLAPQDATFAERQHLLAGKRVLAVDGIDRERQQIGDNLLAWECPFEQVATLAEALEAVARAEAAGHPFSVILTDCRLAVGDEYVLLQKLAKNSRLPIIGLGTNPDDETMAHLRQLGVRHVLRDPIRPSALFNALVSVLSVDAARPSHNDDSGPARQAQQSRLSGHILVAEDNSINQMFVRELLKHCGCTCDIVNNGDEALTALQKNRYDLALMDCQMPEMDGFTATREIRRRETAAQLNARLPIIALTANALQGDRERCLETGMDDYLSKPLNASQLQAMLTKYLSQPRVD